MWRYHHVLLTRGLELAEISDFGSTLQMCLNPPPLSNVCSVEGLEEPVKVLSPIFIFFARDLTKKFLTSDYELSSDATS